MKSPQFALFSPVACSSFSADNNYDEVVLRTTKSREIAIFTTKKSLTQRCA